MAGRASKPTEDVLAKACEVLRLGAPRRLAAGYAGISETTFWRRMQEDETFASAIKRAEYEGEASALASIKKAATGYPVLRTVTKTVTSPIKDAKGVVILVDNKPIYATDETKTITESREFAWQAGAWILERRKPEDYARFVFDPSKFTPEQMAYLTGLATRSEPSGDSSPDDDTPKPTT